VVARFTEDHAPRPPNCIGENLIVARQFLKLRSDLIVEIAEALRRNRRRHAVRLGKDNVKGNGRTSQPGELGD
jgi:hypothetical protein